MARYFVIALLVLAPAATDIAQAGGKKLDKDVRIKDQLTRDDPKDRRRNGASKVHLVRMKRGLLYQIDMVSNQFDSYLFLEDKAGNQLAEDDDGGGNLNARIMFNCPKDGEYRVVCTCFQDAVGAYTLTVKQAGKEQKVANAHGLLLGKAAPTFHGDFALNGQPVELSSLKGKVVLVAFWEARSAPSVAAFPRLRDWYKAYKADGLEIVGVTFYNFEMGHKVGFDKETGKITDLPKASKESEQAMLKELAAYHKLEHLVMALPKDDALTTFNAYAVNGLPQFVLIDRQGMVRVIRVGEREQALEALEGEIKKLLAEK
jgi:glutathione peroxidase-family protein